MVVFSDAWNTENEVQVSARTRGDQSGATSVSKSAGSLLETLASLVNANAVVEVGTGTGVTTLRLLAGLNESGTLTTIDANASNQDGLKSALKDADLDASRVRTIAGDPSEVLPRLADESYDLLLINDSGVKATEYFEQASRLLRTGGVFAVSSAAGKFGSAADTTNRSPEATAAREFLSSVQESDAFTSSLIPLGDGILIAVKR